MKKQIGILIIVIVFIGILIFANWLLNKQSQKRNLSEANVLNSNMIQEVSPENSVSVSLMPNEVMENTITKEDVVEENIKKVTGQTFKKEVIESEKTVLIDFYADWCGPCKILSPIIKEIAEETEKVKVVQIDVDEEEELAMEYGIMSIPTMVVIKDGEEVDRRIGVAEKEEIIKMLSKY